MKTGISWDGKNELDVSPHGDMMGKVVFITICAGIVLMLFGMSATVVGVGKRGVKFDTISGNVGILNEGLHFMMPLVTRVYMYDVTINKYSVTNTSAASKDLQDVSSSVSLNYRLDPLEVDDIAKRVGMDFEDGIIAPALQESIKATTAQFTAEEMITKRSEVKVKIRETLSSRLTNYGIDVVELNIENLEFSAEFNAAINKKVTTEQEALAAENQLKTVGYVEQQKVIIATKEAEALLTKTNATAQAKIMTAEADAKAYELVQQKLTPLIIQKMQIDRWDGKLPMVTSGNTLFSLGGNSS